MDSDSNEPSIFLKATVQFFLGCALYGLTITITDYTTPPLKEALKYFIKSDMIYWTNFTITCILLIALLLWIFQIVERLLQDGFQERTLEPQGFTAQGNPSQRQG
ncbi:uncharacterized protein LOC131958226 isoform X2 [Physella acuta]|nr:uncharacterized protein LOC131958226 isoform X2 [Physella acuta]